MNELAHEKCPAFLTRKRARPDQDIKTEGQVHPQAHPDLSQQN